MSIPYKKIITSLPNIILTKPIITEQIIFKSELYIIYLIITQKNKKLSNEKMSFLIKAVYHDKKSVPYSKFSWNLPLPRVLLNFCKISPILNKKNLYEIL